MPEGVPHPAAVGGETLKNRPDVPMITTWQTPVRPRMVTTLRPRPQERILAG
jgi:hypothetical protein